MDTSEGPPRDGPSLHLSGKVLCIIITSCIYLSSLALTAALGTDWTFFKLVYPVWFISFFALVFLLAGSRTIDLLGRLGPVWVSVILFSLTLLLHVPFLLGEPSMSQDIMRMERRGELLQDGRFPYRDFTVNKPPLYIWMVGLLSLPFGPQQLVFRIAFTISSALVPVVMFLLHRAGGMKGAAGSRGPFGFDLPGLDWSTAALAYSLCPVPILETGMGGHFDPVVVLATIASFYFLVKDRPVVSGLLLGIGFSLKLYPMFLAPVFFLAIGRWSSRVRFTAAFFVVPILASVPVLLVDPSLMGEYLRYQFVSWYSGFSIRYMLDLVLSALSLPDRTGYYLMTSVLFIGSIFLYLGGMARDDKRGGTHLAFSLLLVLSGIGLGLSSVFFRSGAEGTLDRVISVISLSFSVAVISLSVYTYLHMRPEGRTNLRGLTARRLFTGSIPMEQVPLIASCALVLVVLTSAQFHPWYIAWILPFSLASGNVYWSWSTLALLSSLQYNYYPPWELGGF